jgi:polygalacturonase
VKQESGAKINCDGARWWDTKGSNGGKTKPKFFYAHKLNKSNITGLKVYNTPVQGFSIQADHLTITDVTIDNSAGTSKGHNTDAFDVGSSTYITIDGATIYNQDDCLAINSGQVGDPFPNPLTSGMGSCANVYSNSTSPSPTATATAGTASPSAPSAAAATTPLAT